MNVRITTEFLQHIGFLYKYPSDIALEILRQNKEAMMVADKQTWEHLGGILSETTHMRAITVKDKTYYDVGDLENDIGTFEDLVSFVDRAYELEILKSIDNETVLESLSTYIEALDIPNLSKDIIRVRTHIQRKGLIATKMHTLGDEIKQNDVDEAVEIAFNTLREIFAITQKIKKRENKGVIQYENFSAIEFKRERGTLIRQSSRGSRKPTKNRTDDTRPTTNTGGSRQVGIFDLELDTGVSRSVLSGSEELRRNERDTEATLETSARRGRVDGEITSRGDSHERSDGVHQSNHLSGNTERVFGEELQREHVTIVDTKTNIEYAGRVEDELFDLSSFSMLNPIEKNVEAIRLAKEINRVLTDDEKQALLSYSGFGAYPDAFKRGVTSNERLLQILTSEEYRLLKESTLTSFYTPPELVESMFEKLVENGFTGGTILEPSAGLGAFWNYAPMKIKENSTIDMVEIDPTVSMLTDKLYEEDKRVTCINTGFQDVSFNGKQYDLVIGNVPFGEFSITDENMDRSYLIHDYFFLKALDVVKPGGIVAFITSAGTLDKRDSTIRRKIDNKAKVLGVMRLPHNTFTGTKVVTDVIFMQKADTHIKEQSFIQTTSLKSSEMVESDLEMDGIQINRYYMEHPTHIIGTLAVRTGRFGNEMTVKPLENGLESLKNVRLLQSEAKEQEIQENVTSENIIFDKNKLENFSFFQQNEKIYYHASGGEISSVDDKQVERVEKFLEVKHALKTFIRMQKTNITEDEYAMQSERLNTLYDEFKSKYGALGESVNKRVLSIDDGYYLTTTLETSEKNEKNKTTYFKSTIFSQRLLTVDKKHIIENPIDALNISLAQTGAVDLQYMSSISDYSIDELIESLCSIQKIYQNPRYLDPVNYDKYKGWELSDVYVSGNIDEKLAHVEAFNRAYKGEHPVLESNSIVLQEAMPTAIAIEDINIDFGITWFPPNVYSTFIEYTLSGNADVMYSDVLNEWKVRAHGGNHYKNTMDYGTRRISGATIIERLLNKRDIVVRDATMDDEGRKIYVVNQKETLLAQSKAELLKAEFKAWVLANDNISKNLSELYNKRFNTTVLQHYDGDFLTFDGMNQNIELRKHQKDAVARTILGGNSLFGHVVGAGKTFTIIASVMEKQRLNIANKSLIVVPNHLVGQWGKDFLKLYPLANVLVADETSMTPANRKQFVAKIAVGQYDAIIMSHSALNKIPMSATYVQEKLSAERDKLEYALERSREEKYGEANVPVKTLQNALKKLDEKLKKEIESRRDNVLCFEDLGVDAIYVDEAHEFKNLFLQTKMQNVAGIGKQSSQKAMDMYMKVSYINEQSGEKNVCFATGTPISNSMSELYNLQRYLQPSILKRLSCETFDEWASTFGDCVTAMELAPEGTGFRMKTRFAKFYNLPELMTHFKLVADIQTNDMLNLPVPKVNHHTILVPSDDSLKSYMEELVERARIVRSNQVDAKDDNMLKITTDGRKAALDIQSVGLEVIDESKTKASYLTRNVYDIYQRTETEKSTQLIFCDLSTPKSDKSDIYNQIKQNLLERGVAEQDIAFIHDYNTNIKKQDLFEKVRRGDVRILIGSTFKMGAGTNVQTRLIAEHHIDVPWRPSDVEQREGRIIRQGNTHNEVEIFKYVKEASFDAYSWQIIEQKQRFISQIMTSKVIGRSADDIDDAALSYAEIKALASGNPLIKEKMELDQQIEKLKVLKNSYLQNKMSIETELKGIPARLDDMKKGQDFYQQILDTIQSHKADDFVTIYGTTYDKLSEGIQVIYEQIENNAYNYMVLSQQPEQLGGYKGMQLSIGSTKVEESFFITVNYKKRDLFTVELLSHGHGTATRIDNRLESVPVHKIKEYGDIIKTLHDRKEGILLDLDKPFEQEQTLISSIERSVELDNILNVSDKEEKSEDYEIEEI